MRQKPAAIIIIITLSCITAFAAAETGDAARMIRAADSHFAKGEFRRAGDLFERLMPMMDKTGDASSYIYVCLKLAECYKALGYHKRAMPVFRAAMPFLKKSRDIRYNTLFLTGLADLRLTAGEPEESLKHVRNALKLAGEANNPELSAMVFNTVANIATWSEDFETALQYYNSALELLKGHPDANRLKIKLLMNRFRLLALRGDSKAMQDFRVLVQVIEKLPDGYFKASCLLSAHTIAREMPGANNTEAFRDLLEKASAVAYKSGNPKLISLSCGWMGEMHEKTGRLKEAEKLTQQAVFFARQSGSPEILYLWQWQMGRIFKAKNDFKGAMEFYAGAISTLNPIRTQLFSGHRHRGDFFNTRVKPVYLGMAELLLGRISDAADERAREKLMLAARETMEMLKTAELDNFFQDECSVNAGKKSGSLEGMPANAMLLYPISLPENLVILATFSDRMEYRRVSVNQRELTETVKRFRAGLQNRTVKTFIHDAGKLYDWLIRPFEKHLEQHSVDTMVVAPDGILRLIPFSTLFDGKKFLVEKQAVSTIPAVNLTDFRGFDFTEKKHEILISGISEGVQGFSPLPSVKSELRDISEIMGASGFYMDEKHNLKNLKREFEAKAYSMVHLATHGVFGHNARNTFLLLHDGRLDMNGLASLLTPAGFRESPVELLTLSACQTALGDERAALGLAGVAVRSGVKSVLATLWFIDDEATSLVVREFYRQLKQRVPKARALQNAQMMLMAKKRYRHPAYWAPFLLIGGWR